jgi:Zn-dependent peptidase ImmA (M78 family)
LLKDSIESFGDTLETTGFMGKTEQRLEIQANNFASAFLIPKEIIQNELGEMLEKYDIRRLPIYVDTQKCNISNYHMIVGEFAQKHNLSKKVVAYRLMDLNLLEITYGAKSTLL